MLFEYTNAIWFLNVYCSSIPFFNGWPKVDILEKIVFSVLQKNVIWHLSWPTCITPGDHAKKIRRGFLGNNFV